MSSFKSYSFGHYKVIDKLGAGGMGEVFLAEDTRLERKVALKLLPERFSDESEALRRFKQEAKAASALNHPNIITVYEIGGHEGSNFIATEFIDGRTLRERMRERLSFDEALSIIVQTAEALSAAHQAGIVHRDVKPENIMVRKDGYVKVLDFGLAKLTEGDGGNAKAEDATRKLVMTNPGVVMGTAAYMSPEQARGLPVDAGSDIFSFGAVMHEMLAGQPPFAGETMMDVIQAVISTEPTPLKSLAEHLPQELIRIVGKTLKKKREHRYHSTKDLLNDLKDLREELLLEAKLEQTAVPEREVTAKTTTGGSHSTNASGSNVKDSLLLTEIENSTDEAIFDHTLKTALAFALAQSPFLDIFPEQKVSQALRLMGREPTERVTKELGYEICLRQGLKAFITGSISSFGSIYVLTLEAVNARTGASLGREFEQVASREEVLNALSRGASGLREKLGESLSSIEQFGVPVEYITTSSLEALKFFTLGHEQVNSGKTFEAIPFYKKALEIDSAFSSVYMALGVLYANTGQWNLATEMVVKAYGLRDNASENEKLRVTYFYYNFVTGEIDKAINTLEVWRKTYPSHSPAFVNLSDNLERIGQSEKAIGIVRECLRFDGNNAILYMNMAESLLSLDRYAEVKETCQRAFEKTFDGDHFHMLLYIVAFIENDTAAMTEHLDWFSGRADEYIALDLQTRTSGFRGEWRRAQDGSRRAIDLANRSGAAEVAGQYAADQAVRIAFWSNGTGIPKGNEPQLKSVLKTQTNNALKHERAVHSLTRSALALAVAGEAAEAESLVAELKEKRPKDTLVHTLWLPLVHAAFELQNGRAKEAIEELEIAKRYEKVGEFFPQYLRGLAYAKLNKTKQATREFDKIVNNRGEGALSSIYPLAQLGKARSLKDKAEYEKFFELWKDADKDMPALVEAKKEYAEL